MSNIEKLSKLLVEYSTEIKPGEKCLIDFTGKECRKLVCQLVKDVYAAGGIPYVKEMDSIIHRELLKGISEAQLEDMAKWQLAQMKEMNAYIAVRGGDNISELSDIPTATMNLYYKVMDPVLEYRVNNTKWVVLRYPNGSMAQLAEMSTEGFEEFYYEVCTMDYGKMSKAMDSLVDLMNRTDKVRLTAKGTDLTFSIKDIPAIKCDGKMNIPDGEVYTAPVLKSMNGKISYNTPSENCGFTFENIVFEVENGKIVKATANDTDRINEILDKDEGARYFGEFAIGVNPFVRKPMKDTLFDEKIDGSIHLTPGSCYEDAPNGNESAEHWDLVLIQRPEYGGGEIWFDDVLVRKDGRFVIPELQALNPENLK